MTAQHAYGGHGGLPAQRTTLLQQAGQWVAAGRADHAATLYRAALDMQPYDARTRMQLADCLVRCLRPVEAASEYILVAEDYATKRRDREALALCYRALHLDARQIVYVAVASMLRRLGRQARPLCATAAEAHLGAGRIADGFHMLRLGAEIDANNPHVRRRLAALYLAHHMISDAVLHLTEAGRLLLAAGNNAAYVEVAEQILQHAPRNVATLRELPRVLLRMGEPQRAVARLSQLMRMSPGDPEGYEILAHAYAVLGRTTTALSILDRLDSELRADGHHITASAILERARNWRHDDPEFTAGVAELIAPKGPPPPPPPPRPVTQEGTVVLDLRDLLAATQGDEPEVLDASDLIEIEASIVRPAPRRTPPPHRPTPPSVRAAASKPPPLPAQTDSSTFDPEATQSLDLSELELTEDTGIFRATEVTVSEASEDTHPTLSLGSRVISLPPPLRVRSRG